MANGTLPFWQSCDTMVATPSGSKHGHTVFAKNSDRPWDECQPLELHGRKDHSGGSAGTQFVDVPQVETTFRHVGSRPWWCWGYEHGFNEHQVVIGNEALPSRLEPYTQGKLIGMELLRLGLERGRTAREAVEVMTALISEYGQGKFENDAGVRTYDNGYIVADPTEAYVIETAGHEWAVKQMDGALGISNVYSVETDYVSVAETAEPLAREEGWWSSDQPFSFADAFTKSDRTEGSGAMRRKRSCAVLGQASGTVDVRTMMATLSDHSDASEPNEPFQTGIHPGSGICVHFGHDEEWKVKGGNTAASLVADLCSDGSRLPVYWCSFYSPCLSVFYPVFIEAELPGVLGKGGQHAEDDPESPWWRVHALNIVVREAGEDAVRRVRERWQSIQEEWMVSASEKAVEAKRLIDAGDAGVAQRLLTEYVGTNVELMLGVVGEMMEEVSGVGV